MNVNSFEANYDISTLMKCCDTEYEVNTKSVFTFWPHLAFESIYIKYVITTIG